MSRGSYPVNRAKEHTGRRTDTNAGMLSYINLRLCRGKGHCYIG